MNPATFDKYIIRSHSENLCSTHCVADRTRNNIKDKQMGRGLKIRKYQDGQVIDDGFPNDGTTNNGYDDNQPGIVGGVNEDSDQIRCDAAILVKGVGTITADTGNTTVTGTTTHFTTDSINTGSSQLWVDDGNGGYTSLGIIASVTNDGELELDATSTENVTDSAWYYTATSNSSIVRQKGSRKFLVAGTSNTIQDESIAAGQAYMIASVGNTDWQALGADATAAQYDIFTATRDGTGLTTNGEVYPVATCLLVDLNSPTEPNTMSVAIYDDGDTYYASRLKNRFSTNFATPYANTVPGVTYSATFFNDSGNTLPDPSAPGDLVYTLAGTENWC